MVSSFQFVQARNKNYECGVSCTHMNCFLQCTEEQKFYAGVLVLHCPTQTKIIIKSNFSFSIIVKKNSEALQLNLFQLFMYRMSRLKFYKFSENVSKILIKLDAQIIKQKKCFPGSVRVQRSEEVAGRLWI